MTKTTALMLMLATVAGAAEPVQKPLKACIVACRHDGRDGEGVESCFYEEKAVCGRRQAVCTESDTRACHPQMTNLGSWNPGLNQYEYPR